MKPGRSHFLLLGVIAVLAAITPLASSISPYFFDILISIGINLLLASSLNLINGYTGQFSLGHAGFMAVGAYTSSWLSLHGTTGSSGNIALFLGSLLLGSFAAGLTGLAVGLPSLRLRGDYLAIVTLAFNQIIKCVIQNTEPLGAQRGLGGMLQYTGFFTTFTCVALALWAIHNLVQSTYGRGFLATHDDEIAAESIGINTTRYKVVAFSLGAFFAGTAGGLYAHFKQFIHPEGFTYIQSIDIVVMVILGGMGNMLGVCLAAVLLTILPEALRFVSHIESLPAWLRHVAENRMILYAVILILLMLLRPQGLLNFRQKTSTPGSV